MNTTESSNMILIKLKVYDLYSCQHLMQKFNVDYM